MTKRYIIGMIVTLNRMFCEICILRRRQFSKDLSVSFILCTDGLCAGYCLAFLLTCDDKIVRLMMRWNVNEKIRSLLAVLLAVLFTVGVGASPAVADSVSLPLSALSCDSVSQVQLGSDLFKNAEFSDVRFAEIGKELFSPPVASGDLTKSSQFAVRSLPAIPATFFMVLMGFLCVSLARDRKLWLRVAFGVLYLGVAGVNAVPQLLFNLESIKNKRFVPKGVICELKNFIRPQCGDQGTRYIGLLRRMTAIPCDASFAKSQGKGSIATHYLSVLFSSFVRLVPPNLHSCQPAIISHYNPQFSLAHSSQVFTLFSNSCFCSNAIIKSEIFKIKEIWK